MPVSINALSVRPLRHDAAVALVREAASLELEKKPTEGFGQIAGASGAPG